MATMTRTVTGMGENVVRAVVSVLIGVAVEDEVVAAAAVEVGVEAQAVIVTRTIRGALVVRTGPPVRVCRRTSPGC